LVPSLDDAEEELERVLGLPGKSVTIIVFIILGIIALPLGADLVVEGAAGLAANWGVSEAVIGLSLIALGTSLPELSTTVIAAFHKSSDVAIGNVVGSNVFNILAIFGITALLTDIPVDPEFLKLDVWIMLGCSVLLLLFVLFKATIGKAWGVALLAAYLSYMFVIF
jgi:cation:H+ antiporter